MSDPGPRDDANGPIVMWLDYGTEGWRPKSFDTIKDALLADRYGSGLVITEVVDLARLRVEVQ